MPKSKPEIFLKEEINKIIDASMLDEYYYVLFLVAKKTGRRLAEYYDLKVKDIDFDRQIMVTKVLKKRRRVESEAVLDNELCRELRKLIERNKLKPSDYVFRKYSYRTIQYRTKQFVKKVGIQKNFIFHNFRHYFITELIRNGWSLSMIQKLTGHTSLASLGIYDHVVARDIKQQAQDALNNL